MLGAVTGLVRLGSTIVHREEGEGGGWWLATVPRGCSEVSDTAKLRTVSRGQDMDHFRTCLHLN